MLMTLFKNKAFTLIELLVVVSLIGILSAVGIVAYSGYTKSSKEKKAELSLNSINLAQQEYKSNNGNYYIIKAVAILQHNKYLIIYLMEQTHYQTKTFNFVLVAAMMHL